MWALAVSKASLVTDPPDGFLGVLSSPAFLNARFLLGPFLVFTILAVCCGNISYFYGRVPIEAAAAQVVLQILERSYDPAAQKAQTLDVIRNGFGPALQRVFDTSNTVAGWLQVTWTAWFFSAAYLYIVRRALSCGGGDERTTGRLTSVPRRSSPSSPFVISDTFAKTSSCPSETAPRARRRGVVCGKPSSAFRSQYSVLQALGVSREPFKLHIEVLTRSSSLQ